MSESEETSDLSSASEFRSDEALDNETGDKTDTPSESDLSNTADLSDPVDPSSIADAAITISSESPDPLAFNIYNQRLPPVSMSETISLARMRLSPLRNNPDSDDEGQDQQAKSSLFHRRSNHGLTTYVPLTEARRSRIDLQRRKAAGRLDVAEAKAEEELTEQEEEDLFLDFMMKEDERPEEEEDEPPKEEEDDPIAELMSAMKDVEQGIERCKGPARRSVEREADPSHASSSDQNEEVDTPVPRESYNRESTPVRELETDARGREITPVLGSEIDESRKRKAQDSLIPPRTPRLSFATLGDREMSPAKRLRTQKFQDEQQLELATTPTQSLDGNVPTHDPSVARISAQNQQKESTPMETWHRDTSDSDDNSLVPWGSSPEKERERKVKKQLKKKAKKYTKEDLSRVGRSVEEMMGAPSSQS